MKDFNIRTKNDDKWFTPPEIIRALGEFDLDPCFIENRLWDTAKKIYTKLDDGLSKQWFGRVWLNPPYGKETFKWVKKLSEHGNGIALIFARTETKGFHNFVWDKADAIFFFKGRLSFYDINGNKGNTAPAPSCLIAYGKNNIEAIKQSKLDGKLIYLK